jgi:hypothetical protein
MKKNKKYNSGGTLENGSVQMFALKKRKRKNTVFLDRWVNGWPCCDVARLQYRMRGFLRWTATEAIKRAMF